MRRTESTPLWQGLLVGGASVLLTLFAAEIGLRFTSLGTPPLKRTVPTLHGFAQCYRSRDPALPIDLTVDRQRTALSRILFAGDGRAFELGATRCVTYDLRLRRRGTHPERGRQVAIVGDSFAFGEGITDQATVGAALAERFPSIGFRNLAVMGADSRDVGELVDRALDDSRPPTDIVYFYNLNDVRETEEMWRLRNPMRRRLERRLQDMRTGQHGWLERHCTLCRFAEGTWLDAGMSRFTIQRTLGLYFDPANARSVSATWTDVRAMAASARARGVPFWFVIYPLMARDLLGRYPFESIHRLVMNACKSWGVHCIDGQEAFAQERRMARYVVDRHDEHPNAAAQRKMADYLASIPLFLDGGRSARMPVPAGPVRLPAGSLSPASPEVTGDDVVGPVGEYHAGGAMLSLEVEPSNAASYVLSLRARAMPCRDEEGEKWPRIGVFCADEPAAAITVDSAETKTFTSLPFPITRRVRLQFVFLNDYEDAGCRRTLRVESFGIGEATPQTVESVGPRQP